MTDPLDIVRRSYQAFVAGDRASLEALLAEDFTFTSPLDNRLDRRTYFERCWPNHGRITGFRYQRLIAQGDVVVVTYEAEASDGPGFRNTEVLTLRDGRIVAAEVYFGWSLPHKATSGGSIDP